MARASAAWAAWSILGFRFCLFEVLIRGGAARTPFVMTSEVLDYPMAVDS